MSTARATRGPWPAMTGALVSAAILWPVLLAASAAAHTGGRTHLWSDVVYLASSHICHQRPERSFHSAGFPWPVCARCSGLYAAAPFGALAALPGRRRRATTGSTPRVPKAWRQWLAMAALPTVATLMIEWSGLSAMTNAARAMAALPLGLAIAWAIVDVLPVEPINQVH